MCQGDTRIRCLWTYHTSPRVAIFPERLGCKRAQRSEKAIVNGWSSLSSRIASRDIGNCVRVCPSSMVPAGAITWHVRPFPFPFPFPFSCGERPDQPQPGSEIEPVSIQRPGWQWCVDRLFLLMRTKRNFLTGTFLLRTGSYRQNLSLIAAKASCVVYSAWPII